MAANKDINRPETNHSQIVSLIWNIADDVLRDVFLRGQYRDVTLPMVVRCPEPRLYPVII